MQPLILGNGDGARIATAPGGGLPKMRACPTDSAGRALKADFGAVPAAFARVWAFSVFLTLAFCLALPAGDSVGREDLVATLFADRAHAVKAGDWAVYRYRGDKDESGYFHISVVKVEKRENTLLATVRYQERDGHGDILSEKEETVPAAGIIEIITGIDWTVQQGEPDGEKQAEIARTSVALFNGNAVECLQVRGTIDFLVFDMDISVFLSGEVPFGLVQMTWSASDGGHTEEAASAVLVGYGHGGLNDPKADRNMPDGD